MGKMILEVDLVRLTAKGRRALGVLLDELCTPTVVVPADDLDAIAEHFYAQIRKQPQQAVRRVLDAVLDKGSLAYKDLCDVSRHPQGGRPLSGVLSSMARIWQRIPGPGVLHRYEGRGDTSTYRIASPQVLESLRRAREKINTRLKEFHRRASKA